MDDLVSLINQHVFFIGWNRTTQRKTHKATTRTSKLQQSKNMHARQIEDTQVIHERVWWATVSLPWVLMNINVVKNVNEMRCGNKRSAVCELITNRINYKCVFSLVLFTGSVLEGANAGSVNKITRRIR